MTLPEINRHWIGIPALALAIAALGFVGNKDFNRRTHNLPQISSAEINQPASATNGSSMERWLSQLRRIPQNAFGSAQSQNPSENQPRSSIGSEARNWTEEEWRLASAAVAAYRRGGKAALNSAASSDTVWQPPEEIANKNGGSAK